MAENKKMPDKLSLKEYQQYFYDENGNRKDCYIIEIYSKNSANNWYLNQVVKTRESDFYVLNNKVYYRKKGSLLAANMDFNTKDLMACCRIKEVDHSEYIKVVKAQILCKNKSLKLCLFREDYSNGTTFYSLRRPNGKYRADHASHNLADIVAAIDREIAVDSEYVNDFPEVAEEVRQLKRFKAEIQKFVK